MNRIAKILLATIALAGSHQARGDDGGPITGRYWFDHSTELTSFTPGSMDIATDGLREGMHILNAYVEKDGQISSVKSQWFLKTFGVKQGEKYKTTVFVDGKPLQTYDTQAQEGGVMSLSLDVNALPLGIHTLQAQVVTTSGVATDVKTAMFMRMPSTAQMATLKGYYTIDSRLTGEIDATMSGNTFRFDFDASQLTPGLHSLSVYMASGLGMVTSVKTAWFIKIPLGGEGVKSYEYWINDNVASTRRVTLDKVANPFELISLVEIDEEPFRSTSYAFAVEDGVAVTYARNDFQVRFSDSEGRISMSTRPFNDTRTRREVADIEPITDFVTTLSSKPAGANAIKWYRFEAEAGDSLALRFDRKVGYEVYGPDAGLLLQATGADAVAAQGLGLTQNGTHYIAVHDVVYGGTASMQFTHIPRFAILEQDVTRTANRGCFEMKVTGNGFDSLQKLVLSGNGKEIDIEQYKVIDKYTLYAMFDLDSIAVDTGDYRLRGSFVNKNDGATEELISSSILTVEQPTPVEIDVEIEAPRIASTPYLAYVKVTNRSNVGVWGIPLNIAALHHPNGGKIDFMDFGIFVHEQYADSIPVVHMTEDLLNTGKSGSFAPTVIPYLAPGKTNTYTIGLTTGAHDIVSLYAWAGKPWSEEVNEMQSEDYDLTVMQQPFEGNLFTFVECCKLFYQLENGLYDTETQVTSPAKQRAAAPSTSPSTPSTPATPRCSFRNTANSAARLTKRGVGHAARSANGAISTRMRGREMLLAMNGPNEAVEQMQNIDRGMLLVGNDLIAASETGNNLWGNLQALLHLLNARNHWKESVPADPNPAPTLLIAESWARRAINRVGAAFMAYMVRKISFATLLITAAALPAAAKDASAAADYNPLQTGVNSLDIVPDARGASMGDLGVASDPDANSQFWNVSKYAFAYSSAGVSLSYTPWLRKLVNDIFLANVAGYWKVGSGDNQALSASLRYFSLGEVTSGGGEGSPIMTLNPYEMAVDLGYSRKLSDKFSMGVAFRYIYSDLGFPESESEQQTVGASAFAADIGGYYCTYPMVGRNECQWTFGFNLSNIGSKVNYDHGANPAFLPAQLRLGTAFTFPLADYHLLALNLDLSKIMVPTMPRENDFDMTSADGQKAYWDSYTKWQQMSSISGIFNSFHDGSAKEELQEIRWSLGAEYIYNDQFFLRAGYFYEHPNKGNRQYLGFGAGFALKVVRLDAAYMVATAASSPLDQTLRFSLTFDMDGIKELFHRR